jgi:hypothetical protein
MNIRGGEKPFTSSLTICPEACYRKKRGGGGRSNADVTVTKLIQNYIKVRVAVPVKLVEYLRVTRALSVGYPFLSFFPSMH